MTPMKPKVDLDPMLQADVRRRRRPVRSIGALMVVVALSGLALGIVRTPRGRIGVRAPVAPRVALKVQPRDRFVIVAPAEIDPGMVVRAREDIDPGMVFNPDTRRRGSAANGPAPVIVTPAPAPVPAPDHAWPR
jgi:hypothetical protein